MRRGTRSPGRPISRASLSGSARASHIPSTRSEYHALPSSTLTRPMDAVLPGGVATRRPLPSSPLPVSGTGLAAVMGAAALPGIFGWRSMHMSDIRYGGYGAMAAAGAYAAMKVVRQGRPRLWVASLAGAAGAAAGVAVNSVRIATIMQDWSEETDAKSGSKFFFNNFTGESAWEPPL